MKVWVETGDKRVFACALEWPGWARSGRTEDDALAALVAYRPRYAAAIGRVPPLEAVDDLEVVERVRGGSGTDFGVPGASPSGEDDPIGASEGKQLARILERSWAAFDAAAKQHARATLRTGPRGGGRDLPKMTGHVLEAELAYLNELGGKLAKELRGDMGAVRAAALELLAARIGGEYPEPGPRRKRPWWTPRYHVRRSAWHALDHAWEIEDRAG